MTINGKLKILKIIRIVLLIVSIPILLVYLGIIVPEYVACLDCVYEGEMGKDIWGNEVQCFGDSKEFGAFFFNFSTMIIAFLSVIWAVVFYLIHHLTKKLK